MMMDWAYVEGIGHTCQADREIHMLVEPWLDEKHGSVVFCWYIFKDNNSEWDEPLAIGMSFNQQHAMEQAEDMYEKLFP